MTDDYNDSEDAALKQSPASLRKPRAAGMDRGKVANAVRAEARGRGDRMEIDEEYLSMLQGNAEYSTLPVLPEMEGFHCMWSSTTNEYVGMRYALANRYVPIKIEEMPEFYDSIKTAGHEVGGEYDGCVRFKEMVAVKIPLRQYYTRMMYYHHEIPRQQEEVIKENMQAKFDHKGKNLLRESEGFGELGVAPARPVFN